MRKKDKGLSLKKKDIIDFLINEDGIGSAKYIEDARKNLSGGDIKSVIEFEMEDINYERSYSTNSRN